VEEQQAEAATPKQAKATGHQDDAERKRQRQALENALADIEEKLAELGWSIHL